MSNRAVDNDAARGSRRDFLKKAAVTSAATFGALSVGRAAHATGSDALKVGLIGCGGRGSGAANNIMTAAPQTQLVAMADLFQERLDTSLPLLKTAKPEQTLVEPSRCFAGFDAYKRVLETDIDIVLIAAASHFHPEMTMAAVEAGKHVFVEKPHGLDVLGLQETVKACELAREKGQAMVSGLCWRYSPHVREAIQRVHDGMIGRIVAIQENYLSQPYIMRTRKPEWSELEYQFQNWYHFNWLSGDQTAQQLIHSIDKASWALGDVAPVKAWGLGGRQVCVGPEYGDQFDSHSIVYEYEDGVRVFAYCHDRPHCHRTTSDVIIGTKGHAYLPQPNQTRIEDLDGNVVWKYSGPTVSMYEMEQGEMVESILAGKPINNQSYMFTSTMLAILGQMVCYTGQEITWEKALSSTQEFRLDRYDWDVEPPIIPGDDGRYPTAMPGWTEFA